MKISTLAILQARMSSTRLPGKVLKLINGKPMIYWQIERIRQSKSIDQLIVATSTDESDDSLSNYLAGIGIQVYRGSLDDVLSRFQEITIETVPHTVIRLTGDCPLVMPELLDEMVEDFVQSNVDYLSNALEPTFPDGLDIEIMKASSLARLTEFKLTDFEREHVTLGILERRNVFNCENFSNFEDLSNMRWTVDYQEDLTFVRLIFAAFKGREITFTFRDVLQFLENNPGIYSEISGDRRNEQSRSQLNGK